MATCIQVVALVLENNKGEILVSQRAQDKHLAGLWEFPGGKVEESETLIQALEREIREELGYQIQQVKPLISLQHSYPEKTVHLNVYYGKDQNPSVFPNENQPLKWVTQRELSELDMPEADIPILAELAKVINR